MRAQRFTTLTIFLCAALGLSLAAYAEEEAPAPRGKSSFAPTKQTEAFQDIVERMRAAKAPLAQRHQDLLTARYDLADRGSGATMSRGKAVQAGVRVKLPAGATWAGLAELSADEIRAQGLWPKGFLPLPHPHHAEGGMLFPKYHITEIKKQTGRDLERFDLDFAMPDHFLPEFPPAMYLTTRPDLGDVAQGHVVTTDNYFALFDGILNPKQLEGMRLLVTPFPQQQYNTTSDRRSIRPSPHDS